MRIIGIDIQNFRKLFGCHIDISKETTLFVGANNSGKTSAMDALAKFLANRSFVFNDITIRFLYKGIIIKHNKTEPTYTKTSLFLCEKRRFFMARTEKGVVATI